MCMTDKQAPLPTQVRNRGQPFVHEVIVDDRAEGGRHKSRSSGILVATGTGSTAWASSALELDPTDVASVRAKLLSLLLALLVILPMICALLSCR